MTNERSSLISIGGEQHEMILTTRATKAISVRYGGLDNLGDKLMKSENMEMALDEIVWLITLLCNQSIEIHNLRNSDKKPLLTEETLELLTSPGELAEYKDAIVPPNKPCQKSRSIFSVGRIEKGTDFVRI